jgi:pilus assembly protein FimV
LIVKSQRRFQTAIAAAITVLFSLTATDSMALSLGRITVQSALGEPLRAEVDVPDINAEEAASLTTTVARPEAFRAAGLEYNPAMASLQISLQRKPDGRPYIRISSDRTVNDPFIDLILEASWASGRIVRDYTMLFDPPNLRQQAPAAPTAAQISPAPASSSPAAAAPSPGPARAAAPASAASTPTIPARTPSPAASIPAAPAKSAAPAAPRATAPAAVKERQPADSQLTVKKGDTASKIASAAKSGSVSLDQMLVALLRANPDAFAGGNINRLKAGAVMNVPSDEQALATPTGEATQIVQAQSKDFNDYRSKLATGAPTSQVAAAERKASGSVQTQVEEKKPSGAALDKLTLSKGAVQDKSAEEQIAKKRAAEDSASRAAELAKNVSELSKLGAASSAAAVPATTASSPAAATGSKLETPTPVIASAASPTPTVAVPAPVAAAPVAAAPAAAAPKEAASPQVKPPVTATAPSEPGMLDDLLENPLAPAGAIGLIALLVGFGFYRARQRKKALLADSSFMESRLQPDSFFNASGGQRIDTHDGAITGSSMVYSPSQLDTADDVDPVAEADVYLAYGRDLQAEEILKEALRTHPGRVAIHEKLLEIHAKRRDLVGFESIAREAYALTGGHGTDWDRICELGLEIDPANSLYQPGGQPSADDSRPGIMPASDSPETFPVSAALPESAPSTMPSSEAALDLDLDLDFSLDDDTPGSLQQAELSASTPSPDASIPSFALDLDLATAEMERQDTLASAAPLSGEELSLPELSLTPDDFTLSDLDSLETMADSVPATSAGQPEPAAAPALTDSGMLEFDLSSLSLELNAPSEEGPETEAPSEDPLATKLALAQEFSAIGDDDGARALIEEVIAEATGDVKRKAQEALSQLA